MSNGLSDMRKPPPGEQIVRVQPLIRCPHCYFAFVSPFMVGFGGPVEANGKNNDLTPTSMTVSQPCPRCHKYIRDLNVDFTFTRIVNAIAQADDPLAKAQETLTIFRGLRTADQIEQLVQKPEFQWLREGLPQSREEWVSYIQGLIVALMILVASLAGPSIKGGVQRTTNSIVAAYNTATADLVVYELVASCVIDQAWQAENPEAALNRMKQTLHQTPPWVKDLCIHVGHQFEDLIRDAVAAILAVLLLRRWFPERELLSNVVDEG